MSSGWENKLIVRRLDVTTVFPGLNPSQLKPDLVFFGELIHDSIKDRSWVSFSSHSVRLLIFPHPISRYKNVEECDRLLVIGTTLATYSAFRIVKHALELKKPVFILNTGPMWADELPGIEKVDGFSGSVLPEAVRTLL